MAETVRHPIALKSIVYRLPEMSRVRPTRDVEYASSPAGPLTFDLYRPGGSTATPPAVILVTGYADVGGPPPLGCAFKEMRAVTSTAQLIAASGMAAVAYTASRPADDTRTLLEHLSGAASSLGIDASRMGVWATSGNVPLALALLTRGDTAMRAGVLLNGFMFEAGGVVAAAARTYRFANPIAGTSPADLRADVPLFIVRSGHDEFDGVNQSIDRFVAAALDHNLPLTLVNHASAPHAFEINDDSPASREILADAVRFLRRRLVGQGNGGDGGNEDGLTGGTK